MVNDPLTDDTLQYFARVPERSKPKLVEVMFADLPEKQKEETAKNLQNSNPGLFPTTEKGRIMLWMTLLVGLFLLGVVSLVATAILMSEGRDAAAMIAVASAVIAGVIGLFSKSPVTSGS